MAVDLGALGGTRTPNLLIRRYLCGWPDSFRSVRDLGLVSPGCTGGSGASEGCSSVRLPAWLPAGDHLFRRSGHIVQDRPVVAMRWADIPDLSARIRCCPSAWQQYWQQWPRGELRHQRAPVRGSLHVELVTLRVEHGDAVLAIVRCGR